MATTYMESGTAATQDLSFFSASAGTTPSSSATSLVPGMPRSVKLLTNGAANTTVDRSLCLQDSGSRIVFPYMFDTLPAGANIILQARTAGGLNIIQIQIGTTGKLNISNTGTGTGTQIGTTILKVNQPYFIGVSYVVTSTTVHTVNVFLNGKLEVQEVNQGTLTNTVSSTLRFQQNLAAGAATSGYIGGFYVDNSSNLLYPGNIIVTAKRPVSAGAANNWTTQIGSGGSGYGTGHAPQVNEQPLSTTNGWSIASSSLIVEEYTIEGASVGDKDVSNPRFQLIDYMGWVYFKSGTADTRNIILAGAATNITTTTSFALYTKIGASTTYPSTNTAIGMNNNSLVALASLAECGILLAYKLPRRVSIS